MQILTKITLSMVAAPLCTFLVEAGTKVGPIGRGARYYSVEISPPITGFSRLR